MSDVLAALRKKLRLVHAEKRAAKNKTYPLDLLENKTGLYWEQIKRRLKELSCLLDWEPDGPKRELLKAEQAELTWLAETGTVRP